MGIGHALFLVDPAHPSVAALEAWEPEEKTCEPVIADGAGDAGPPVSSASFLRCVEAHSHLTTLGDWDTAKISFTSYPPDGI